MECGEEGAAFFQIQRGSKRSPAAEMLPLLPGEGVTVRAKRPGARISRTCPPTQTRTNRLGVDSEAPALGLRFLALKFRPTRPIEPDILDPCCQRVRRRLRSGVESTTSPSPFPSPKGRGKFMGLPREAEARFTVSRTERGWNGSLLTGEQRGVGAMKSEEYLHAPKQTCHPTGSWTFIWM